jgi:hypothetical protein
MVGFDVMVYFVAHVSGYGMIEFDGAVPSVEQQKKCVMIEYDLRASCEVHLRAVMFSVGLVIHQALC